MFARTPSAHLQIKGRSLHGTFSDCNICARNPFTDPSELINVPSRVTSFWSVFWKDKTEASDLFLFLFARSWSKRPFVFAYNTSDLRVLFYHLWIDFYSINDDSSKKMQVHRTLIFIFLCSHELEKDFVKKENRKLWESRYRIKNRDKKRCDSIQWYKRSALWR